MAQMEALETPAQHESTAFSTTPQAQEYCHQGCREKGHIQSQRCQVYYVVRAVSRSLECRHPSCENDFKAIESESMLADVEDVFSFLHVGVKGSRKNIRARPVCFSPFLSSVFSLLSSLIPSVLSLPSLLSPLSYAGRLGVQCIMEYKAMDVDLEFISVWRLVCQWNITRCTSKLAFGVFGIVCCTSTAWLRR